MRLPAMACGWIALASIAHVAAAQDAQEAPPAEMPMTGVAVEELASYDRLATELMRQFDVPGMAVAVAKDGRLVLARGYGLADVERQQPVRPESLFRIASVSKPITAAAVLVLVERGKLDLDATALDLIGQYDLPGGQSPPEPLRQVTVRQLLHHTAGFDRGQSLDPMLSPREMVEALGSPTDIPEIIRFMLVRPLDFEPGGRYAYSNFGYCLLGRIIEQATGKSYEEAVRELVLRPAGIRRMRLGKTRREHAAPDEVCYYPATERKEKSVFPDVDTPVEPPYGGFYIEAMDAHGGWIASAIDLVRFGTFVDGTRRPGLLKPETVRLIESRPAPPVSADGESYYGLGWMIHPGDRGANWSHAGSLPGTISLLVHTHHGMVWAVVVNSRPRGDDDFLLELDRTLWRAYEQVEKWPRHDLFARYD